MIERVTRDSGAKRRRLWNAPMTSVAALLLLAGCSSVPDALNPVEWYEGTTDTVGGWFSDDEPPATADTGSTQGDKDFPNLASVPERPTPSTTAEEREQIQQGLIADRNNARYTDSADASAPADPPRRRPAGQSTSAQSTAAQSTAAIAAPVPPAPPARSDASIPAPGIPAPSSAAPSIPAPSIPAPAQTAAAEPASQPASQPSAEASSGRSDLWPRRPAPEPESRTPMTTGKVPDTHSSVVGNPASASATGSSGRRPLAETLTRADTMTGQSATGTADTRLDSAGDTGGRTPPRSAPAETGRTGPEVTRTLVSETRTQRLTDGTVRTETTRPGASSTEATSMAAAPATDTAMPDTMTAPADPAAADESASVIVDGPSLDQYQLGFSGPAYLVGTVNFAHGSARLGADDLDMVRSIASAAQETDAFIRVIGHASARTAEMDLSSHELVNFQESLARAESVGQALIRAGVPAERVLVEAMSASQPLYFESMPSGEAGNRRAEILFQY